MQKITLTIFTFFSAKLSFGQTAEELNNKSKDLLDKQDFKNAIPLIRQAAEKEVPKLDIILVFLISKVLKCQKVTS